MSNSAAELDQSIFGFIDALSALSDPAAVVDALHRALAMEGVRFFCFNFLPLRGESFADVVLANRWPQDWLSLYVAENYVQDDPAIRYCRRVAQPFEWSAAPFDPVREPRAAEIVERAKDFGRGRLRDAGSKPVGFSRQRLGRRPTCIRCARESRDPSHVTLRVRSITCAESAVLPQQTERDDARARGAELDRVRKVGVGDR
jgi:autoinducer binding domain-containing protein